MNDLATTLTELLQLMYNNRYTQIAEFVNVEGLVSCFFIGFCFFAIAADKKEEEEDRVEKKEEEAEDRQNIHPCREPDRPSSLVR
jgi:hypothetical protein